MPSRTGFKLSGALTWRFDIQKSATPTRLTSGVCSVVCKYIVDSISNFQVCEELEKDVNVQYADGQVKAGYPYVSRCILFLIEIYWFINRI